MVCAWGARACGLRAVAAAKRRLDRIIVQRFTRWLRNDAIESTLRSRSGAPTARSRVPRARQISGARVESASMRFASRCGGA
eukprot:8196567-Lingulodinium_polyedra.AAC.1